MKIVATSDTHGYLPEIPECDIFLHAGDVCPVWDDHSLVNQHKFIKNEFLPWIKNIPAKHKIFIAGNHDFLFEDTNARYNAYTQYERKIDNLWYLNKEWIEVEGIKIYGYPDVPKLHKWAFYREDKNFLELKDKIIEHKPDIVLAHGPPRGYLDGVIEPRLGYIEVGSPFIAGAIEEVQPKYFICGHIHEGFGSTKLGNTDIFNVAYVDEYYTPRKKIVEFDYGEV